MGLLTQGIQIPGEARRPQLRLHGSVAGMASRAPRTGLRTDPSLDHSVGGAIGPEGEEERPESGREGKERDWRGRVSWERGGTLGGGETEGKEKIERKGRGEELEERRSRRKWQERSRSERSRIRKEWRERGSPRK